jgi:hypothetical protein
MFTRYLVEFVHQKFDVLKTVEVPFFRFCEKLRNVTCLFIFNILFTDASVNVTVTLDIKM